MDGPKIASKDGAITSHELIDEVSKQKSTPAQEHARRDGIAERSEQKSTKKSNISKLDLSSMPINDSLPPIPSSRSDGNVNADTNPSPDFTAYLNYQYLNFARPSHDSITFAAAHNGAAAAKPPKPQRKPNVPTRKTTTRQGTQRLPGTSTPSTPAAANNANTVKTRSRGGSHDSIYQTLIALQRAQAMKSSNNTATPTANGRRINNTPTQKSASKVKASTTIAKTPVNGNNRDVRRPLSAPPGSAFAHRYNSNEAPPKVASTFGSGRASLR
jgi:hypothetical protein